MLLKDRSVVNHSTIAPRKQPFNRNSGVKQLVQNLPDILSFPGSESCYLFSFLSLTESLTKTFLPPPVRRVFPSVMSFGTLLSLSVMETVSVRFCVEVMCGGVFLCPSLFIPPFLTVSQLNEMFLYRFCFTSNIFSSIYEQVIFTGSGRAPSLPLN